MTGRSGGSEAGRSLGSGGNRSSNIRPAINDGQWHSFGNSGSSAHTSLSAHNAGSYESGFHSFGAARGIAPGFGRGVDGWRGGYGWGRGWGWGGGWGWGVWGFGFGWPYWGGYWGPGWAFGWDPWLYGPYGYGPYGYAWPTYGYPGYDYDWSDDPPPYRPDASYDYDSPGNYLSPTSSS
jgi:hypothetical protein